MENLYFIVLYFTQTRTVAQTLAHEFLTVVAQKSSIHAGSVSCRIPHTNDPICTPMSLSYTRHICVVAHLPQILGDLLFEGTLYTSI